MSLMAQILLIVAAVAICLPWASHFGRGSSRTNRADTSGGGGGPDCGPGAGHGGGSGGDGGDCA
jgi:hypothetical protein